MIQYRSQQLRRHEGSKICLRQNETSIQLTSSVALPRRTVLFGKRRDQSLSRQTFNTRIVGRRVSEQLQFMQHGRQRKVQCAPRLLRRPVAILPRRSPRARRSGLALLRDVRLAMQLGGQQAVGR